jgi:hypothetical protein
MRLAMARWCGHAWRGRYMLRLRLRLTAVPYSIARHMVHGSRIVVDAKQLRGAPKVAESQLQNPSNAAWKGVADSYWASQAKDPGCPLVNDLLHGLQDCGCRLERLSRRAQVISQLPQSLR